MKKYILLLLVVSSMFTTNVNAQHTYRKSGRIAMVTKKNTKKKARKITVVYTEQTKVPDSIARKTRMVSQQLVKPYITQTGKNMLPDSVYKISTWATYKSKVIGGTAQILIDISYSYVRLKNKRLRAKFYTVNYHADENLFNIHYDSRTRKTRIAYNESHWPGFMHSDKTPTKTELDNDISFALEQIHKGKTKLR